MDVHVSSYQPGASNEIMLVKTGKKTILPRNLPTSSEAMQNAVSAIAHGYVFANKWLFTSLVWAELKSNK